MFFSFAWLRECWSRPDAKARFSNKQKHGWISKIHELVDRSQENKTFSMLKHRWRYGNLKILPPPPEMDPFRGGGGRIFRFFIQFLSYGLDTRGEGNIGVSCNSYPDGWPIGRLCGHPEPIAFWFSAIFWRDFGYFHQNFTKSWIVKCFVNYIVQKFFRG